MAGDNLNGTTLNLKVNSKGGNSYNVTINLQNSTVSFPDPKNLNQNITFPIMNTDPVTTPVFPVAGSVFIIGKVIF